MTAAITPGRDAIQSLLDLFESDIDHIDVTPHRREILTYALRLAAKPSGVREAINRATNQFEALRNAYRGYLPWNSDNSDVKTRLLQIEDMDKAFFAAFRALSPSGEPKP